VDCHVSAMWQKLHSQQLPHGKPHAISSKMWGQGPFSNIFFLQGCFSNFFFIGTKIKIDPNYRDENHIYKMIFVFLNESLLCVGRGYGVKQSIHCIFFEYHLLFFGLWSSFLYKLVGNSYF